MNSLSRNRDFTVFWLGQALSVIGGSVTWVALPVLVLKATGSIVQMGVITVISAVTGIATGIFAGHVIDRTDRRRLMIVCDLARAVLLGALPFLWAAGPRMWLLYVLTALLGVLKTLFDVAYVTAVPSLVPSEDLTAANGRLMGTFAIGTLVGPAVAGIVTGRFGPDWALGLDGATFLVSAASLRWVRLRPRAEDSGEHPASGGTPPVREMLLAGLRFLWAHPLMRPLTVLLTLLTFVTLGATDLLIFRLKDELHRNDTTLGYVMAVSGLGMIVAALGAGRVRRRLGFGVCWLGSVAAIGVAVAGIGVSSSVPVIAVLAAVFMAGMTLGGVCSMTLRQEVTPDHLLGRVTSAFWTVHNAAGPVGAAVLTMLAARHGVPAVSVGAGALCLGVAGAGVLTPLRRGSRPAPAGETVAGCVPGAVSRPRRTWRGRRR